MRLDWLWIGDYKNLKDVYVDFDQGEWVTVVIGWNGTGKSNVLEALAIIFRDLIMGAEKKKGKNKPSFSYKIRYRCQQNYIYIDADIGRIKDEYRIYVKSDNDSEKTEKDAQILLIEDESKAQEDKGQLITVSRFFREQDQYLPKYIFGYYSGHSSRLEEVFREYLVDYYKGLRQGKNPGLRRLFYALPIHSQFVLLAFMLQQHDEVQSLLNSLLGLDSESGIDSVLFVLRQPPWNSPEGDPRFWNARGVVKNFLAKLYDFSLAPIRVTRRMDFSLWGNKKGREFLYLYIKDLITLRELVGQQSPKEFFRDVESTYVSELLEEVRIRIKLSKNKNSVTFQELSEGEQQLLTVLGLLRFTSEEESLFLLDEPDTHLNPRWSVDYLHYLEKFVGINKASRESCHVVMTTHNPLAIAELLKKQIQILKRHPETLAIDAISPEMDPRGMGYSGIVTSDMFGLAAALDSHTLDQLERKRILTLKDEPLNAEERTELERINLELEGYGFRYETRDPIFAEYLRARYEYDSEQEVGQRMVNLTPSERMQRAKQLIQRALSKHQNQE